MAAEKLTLEEVIYNFLIAKQAEGKSDKTILFTNIKIKVNIGNRISSKSR